MKDSLNYSRRNLWSLPSSVSGGSGELVLQVIDSSWFFSVLYVVDVPEMIKRLLLRCCMSFFYYFRLPSFSLCFLAIALGPSIPRVVKQEDLCFLYLPATGRWHS